MPAGLHARDILDQASRAEIDALATLQMPLVVTRAWLHKFFEYAPIVYAAVAAYGLGSLCAEKSSLWIATTVCLGVALIALRIAFTKLMRSHRARAIELVGNRETYFSALAKLWHLSRIRSNKELIRLAQEAGVPADRAEAIIARAGQPAEDRYPTSGDYLTIGFE
ncbi:MAG: hypothetical protein U0Q16_19265 [Bryobacteraceae bacterium]